MTQNRDRFDNASQALPDTLPAYQEDEEPAWEYPATAALVTTQPAAVPQIMLSQREAEALVSEFMVCTRRRREIILELLSRDGITALGFADAETFAKDRLGWSRRHWDEEVQTARFEARIASSGDRSLSIPAKGIDIHVARELAKLPDEKQARAYEELTALPGEGARNQRNNARHIVKRLSVAPQATESAPASEPEPIASGSGFREDTRAIPPATSTIDDLVAACKRLIYWADSEDDRVDHETLLQTIEMARAAVARVERER
jgi:hypothetical protein